MQRFWDKVNKDTEDGCWEWMGSRRKTGECGNFTLNGRKWSAPRVALKLAGLDELRANRRCENKLCVNPEHLAQIQVPVQPILDYIDRSGRQFVEFFDLEEYVSLTGEFGLRLTKAAMGPYDKYLARLTRSTERGWMDYFDADEFCIDVFGYHPALIFGSAWWDYPDTSTNLHDVA